MFGDRIGYGRSERAPFAADPAASRGRLHDEPPSPTRTPFQRDRDRIIHSTAFRRLREKTQVFLVDEGDHYRTRLTHTIEVAQIARALARALRLDEDLAEALALAHDLGHTPFGHAGERALNAAMKRYGGFDHNAQSLRVVTRLERSYPRFDGLNLTWETLEGLAKHNGPLLAPGYDPAALPFAIAEYAAEQDLGLTTHAGPEAQAAAIADDIAYDAHDIDDGLRSGYLTLAAISRVPLVGDLLAAIGREYPGLSPERTRHELVRRLITRMIEDVIGEGIARIERFAPASADEFRAAGVTLIGFSPAMEAADHAIKAALSESVYRHPEIAVAMGNAEALLRRLFDRYLRDPASMPAEWRPAEGAPPPDRARRVADFIAGMTDRYALAEHERLFGSPAELRWPAPRAAE